MDQRVTTLANLLTMSRIVMIPAFFVTAFYHLRESDPTGGNGLPAMDLEGPVEPTFRIGLQILLILIVGSDFLDGYIARKTRTVTMLGSLLDPMADKLFVLSTLVLFTVYKQIPVWLAVAIISKDALTVIGWALFAAVDHQIRAKPSPLGKVAMACTFATIVVVVYPFPLNFRRAVFALTGLTTVACFLQYLWRGLRMMQGPSSGAPKDASPGAGKESAGS